MDKVKDIFKGKGQDAEKTQAFTGQTGSGIDGNDGKIPGSEGGGDVPSKTQNSIVGNEPVADVGHQHAKAKGLSSEAQSGENTSSFTG